METQEGKDIPQGILQLLWQARREQEAVSGSPVPLWLRGWGRRAVCAVCASLCHSHTDPGTQGETEGSGHVQDWEGDTS